MKVESDQLAITKRLLQQLSVRQCLIVSQNAIKREGEKFVWIRGNHGATDIEIMAEKLAEAMFHYHCDIRYSLLVTYTSK